MKELISFDTSKLLKEAGFPQHSEFYWCEGDMGGLSVEILGCGGWRMDHAHFTAPTTDELLNQLPYAININKGPFEYRVSYHIVARVDNINFLNKSLPEALAEMWLYLKKENLLGA